MRRSPVQPTPLAIYRALQVDPQQLGGLEHLDAQRARPGDEDAIAVCDSLARLSK